MTTARIDSVAVLVPVKNEHELLPRLITSLHRAIGQLGLVRGDLSAVVVFSLDRCTDNSAALIRDAGFFAIGCATVGVGAARASAARAVIRGRMQDDVDGLWLASTDADSEVPLDWLVKQVELAERGADVVVGTVRPDFADLDPARRAAWEATHSGGQAIGHVHGANLGLRASSYLRAGGFANLAEHEDVDLVQRAMSAGARVVASDSHAVLTSGRLRGRTSGGYAGYLREQLVPLTMQS